MNSSDERCLSIGPALFFGCLTAEFYAGVDNPSKAPDSASDADASEDGSDGRVGVFDYFQSAADQKAPTGHNYRKCCTLPQNRIIFVHVLTASDVPVPPLENNILCDAGTRMTLRAKVSSIQTKERCKYMTTIALDEAFNLANSDEEKEFTDSLVGRTEIRSSVLPLSRFLLVVLFSFQTRNLVLRTVQIVGSWGVSCFGIIRMLVPERLGAP